MSSFLGIGPGNPVAWSNFYRKGGFKSLLSTASLYFIVIATIIFLTAHLNRDPASTYGGWSAGLLALQSLFLVVIGATRVSSNIRSDLTSGMSESLRMMPLPASHAVAGYLSSAFAAMSGLFTANFFLGLATTTMANLPASRWIAANLILLAFAIFIWTLAAFIAFHSKGAGGIIAVSSFAGFFGNAGILYIAPGLVVLVGPLIGTTIFNFSAAQTELSIPLVLSLCCQFLVGSIFFSAAARRYRRPDAPALSPLLSLFLLLSTVGISLLAILRWEDFRPVFMNQFFRSQDARVPFLGSFVFCLLISLSPLTTFARQHLAWKRLRTDDPEARRPVPAPFLSGLLILAALSLMLFAAPTFPTSSQLAYTLLALYGFCLSIIFLAAWTYRTIDNAKVFLTTWIFLYCLLPIISDAIRHSVADNNSDPVLTAMSSFSPIGLLIETWTSIPIDTFPVIALHLIAPLLPLSLYLLLPRRKSPPAMLA
ncbi:MAG TPA: hypothetical protein VFE58_00040 [Tepidisphaeraceae bacterium]|jgi:hypothetical protein|nr:hypothetical protein [Tepidisphaeraceae bacterium]